MNTRRKSWLFINLLIYLVIHSLTRSFIYYENRILKVQYKERTRKYMYIQKITKRPTHNGLTDSAEHFATN